MSNTQAALLEALKLAVRQNEHDMLMTGEELRHCRAAIAQAEAAPDALRELCAAAYQVVGAADGPVEMLDNLAAAVAGKAMPHAPSAGLPWVPAAEAAQGEAQPVASRWQLVPVTPTDEMVEAAESVDQLYRLGQPRTLARAYQAMLAAAPRT